MELCCNTASSEWLHDLKLDCTISFCDINVANAANITTALWLYIYATQLQVAKSKEGQNKMSGWAG